MNEQVTDKADVLQTIENRFASLEKKVSDQDTEISRLNRLVNQKNKTIRDLRQRLSKYEEPPKDSSNSSIPPTQDSIGKQIVRHTKSLRKKSDRKTGGQPGHEGHFLETNEDPDFIVHHHPDDVCECCGESLADVEAEEIGKSQVVNIPSIQPTTTEYVLLGKRCKCGHMNKCRASKKYTSRISYGSNLNAIIAYFGHSQYIPFARLCEMLRDVFHLHISQGTVQNILTRMGKISENAYREIRDRVEEAEVAGADETGLYVGGEHHWAWVFQNDNLTYLFQDKSRGKAATRKHFPNDLPDTTLVTDRHSTYFRLNVKGHQVCIAHLLRNIQYLTDLDKNQTWSTRLTELLQDAIHLRKSKTMEKVKKAAAGFYERLDRLLEESTNHLHKEFNALKKGLYKCHDYIFTFLTDKRVPYDSNASERGVRNIKVKQKVSGCFRTDAGADTYMKLHSVTDTAKKNGNSKFDVLLALANLQG
ncbi:IS66 family transposase [Hallella bergensis]|uniref:IS66 family transposase n=1 Tax=Hallella bergensis TaxID=242750 RepID=UPI0023F0126A|nr:IS66 family transposase [Hallella bergensis]